MIYDRIIAWTKVEMHISSMYRDINLDNLGTLVLT